MGVRFDAVGDALTRSASLPTVSAGFTALGWANLRGDTNQYGAIFHINRAPSLGYYGLTVAGDGTSLIAEENDDGGSGTESSTILSLTLDTYFRWALVYNGSNSLTGYAGNLGSALSSQSVATADFAQAATAIWLGGNGYDSGLYVFNGDIGFVKLYEAALTQDEIERELARVVPTRFANLWGWWPLLTASHLHDYSGNGRSWSTAGSVAEAGSPPISWGAAPLTMPVVVQEQELVGPGIIIGSSTSFVGEGAIGAPDQPETDKSGVSTVRASGAATSTSSSRRSAASSVSVAAIVTSPQAETGTSAITGAGAVTTTASSGRAGSSAIAASGAVGSLARKGGLAISLASAAGVVASTGTTEESHSGTSTLTASLRVTSLGFHAGSASSLASAAGVATSGQRKAANSQSIISAGARSTVVPLAPPHLSQVRAAARVVTLGFQPGAAAVPVIGRVVGAPLVRAQVLANG